MSTRSWLAGVLIVLVVGFTTLGGPSRIEAPTVAAQDSTSDPNTILIRSYPAGLEARVIPQAMTTSTMGDIYRVNDDYLVGKTPVEATLEPGEYEVVVTLPLEMSFDFRADGEISTLQYLNADGTGFLPGGKIYDVTKRAGAQVLVTALFWPKDQSLADFVATLPDETVIDIGDEQFYQGRFQDHQIPATDWADLLAMLRHTGKLIWYSPDASDYLLIYFFEPSQVVVQPDISITAAPTAEPPDGTPDLVLNAQEPIVAQTSDQAGNLYAVTYNSGTILKVTPNGESTTLYSGLVTCSFSQASITALPDGSLVASHCVNNQDVLLKIDQQGNALTLSTLDNSILSLTSDAEGQVYVGLFVSEGNLTVNFQPFSYLAGAEQISGQIGTLNPDGTLTTLYEGGLPVALAPSPSGELLAVLWGQAGPFSALNQEYSLCDPSLSFWITLSDQAEIAQISDGAARPISDQLDAVSTLAPYSDLFLTYGFPAGEACHIYRMEQDQRFLLSLPGEDIDQSLTAMTVAGGALYFADVDGNLYRVDALSTTEQPVVSAAPTTPAVEVPSDLTITASNASQVQAGARLGRGRPTDLLWAPDSSALVVSGSLGFWGYTMSDLDAEPSLLKSESPVVRMSYGQVGTTLAYTSTSGSNSGIWLMNVGDGSQQQLASGQQSNTVAMSSSGTRLASILEDNSVQLWDVQTRQALRTLQGHSDLVLSLSFSPDEKVLASGGRDSSVRLWDPTTGETVRVLDASPNWVDDLTFSPDGTLLAAACENEVRVWEVATGNSVAVIDTVADISLRVAFSPDGTLLASAGGTGSVKVWSTTTGELVRELAGHTGSVVAVAFRPDGAMLASASSDGTVRLWDATTGEEVHSWEGYKTFVRDIDFSPDGRTLASVGTDISLWDVSSDQLVHRWGGSDWGMTSTSFSPDGRWLAAGSWDNTVLVLDISLETESKVLEGHIAAVHTVAFSPDSTLLASAGEDRTIRLWEPTNGTLVRTLEGSTDQIWAVAFSPDGTQLASAGWDNVVRLWDVATGVQLRTFEGHQAYIAAVAFSPDGQHLASGGADGTVRLWDVASGQALFELDSPPGSWNSTVLDLAFSPDGTVLASAGMDNNIYLWNSLTGELLNMLQGHTEPVWGLAFGPDGSVLASGSDDGIVQLWSLR